MHATLVVVTWERADALARVLATAAAQERRPDELIVADDGSGPATRDCIARFAAVAPFPVRHLWQPHAGWGVCRVRNAALAAARAGYLVYVDGDMLLAPDFLAAHLAAARPGYWVQGTRLPLDAAATARALGGEPLAAVTRGRRLGRRRPQALRLPALAPWVARLGNAVVAVKGCNQGFWRDDLLRVNGWNEDFDGWGPEDKELCVRLGHAGIRRRTLLWSGHAWHLAHAPGDRARLAANQALLARTRRERLQRCERGVDRHLAASTDGADGHAVL